MHESIETLVEQTLSQIEEAKILIYGYLVLNNSPNKNALNNINITLNLLEVLIKRSALTNPSGAELTEISKYGDLLPNEADSQDILDLADDYTSDLNHLSDTLAKTNHIKAFLTAPEMCSNACELLEEIDDFLIYLKFRLMFEKKFITEISPLVETAQKSIDLELAPEDVSLKKVLTVFNEHVCHHQVHHKLGQHFSSLVKQYNEFVIAAVQQKPPPRAPAILFSEQASSPSWRPTKTPELQRPPSQHTSPTIDQMRRRGCQNGF